MRIWEMEVPFHKSICINYQQMICKYLNFSDLALQKEICLYFFYILNSG